MLSSKKKIGSREEVYNDLARKTSGGMKKNDIIKKHINKKNQNKTKYLSRKISERMKNNPNIKRKKRTIHNKIGNQNKTKKAHNYPRLKSKKNFSFNMSDNLVKDYYCPALNNIQVDNDIDETYNINIDDIEEIDLTELTI